MDKEVDKRVVNKLDQVLGYRSRSPKVRVVKLTCHTSVV